MKDGCPERIYLNIHLLRKGMMYKAQDPDAPEHEYIRKDIVDALVEAEGDNGYGKGCEYTRERIIDALLSEVLPCFMHGGEADEVVAKLEEVLDGNEDIVNRLKPLSDKLKLNK